MASTATRSVAPARSGALAAFSHPAFRLYFAGQLVSVSGTWMQAVALQVVVYNLTGSKLALGLVACVQGLPALLLMPFAGVLVERIPRRQTLVGTQTAMMLLALVMAALSATNTLQIWHIVALSLCLGVCNAVDAPARLSFIVEMVSKEHLPSGVAMNAIMFNVARILGPTVGGIALTTVGAAWCFFLNGLSFLAVILSLLLMKVPPAQLAGGRVAFLRPMREGLQFVRGHPTIGPLIMLSAITSTFGMTFAVLIPAFANEVLGNTELGTAALTTAQGVGAVAAAVVAARLTDGGWRGKLLAVVSLVAPLGVIVLSLTVGTAPALAVIGVAGFGFVCQYVLMNTLIQTQVPDVFRGRVLSLYSLTFFGLSPFGNLLVGSVAQGIGTLPTILLCGVVCLIGVGRILWRAPQLARLP